MDDYVVDSSLVFFSILDLFSVCSNHMYLHNYLLLFKWLACSVINSLLSNWSQHGLRGFSVQ